VKKEIKVLKKVLNLLENGWCQDSWARDNDGNTCSVDSKYAKCYCLVGAVCKVTKSPSLRITVRHQLDSNIPINYGGLLSWNDNKRRTKQQVINLVKKTIKGLENEV
jgi:hypothetical protein